MRFIVDANLPPRVARFLEEQGHEAHHVAELSIGAAASDNEIVAWAESHQAAVVSKDSDFRSLQLAAKKPTRLLIVATGNISTRDLIAVLSPRLQTIVDALAEAECVELHRAMVVIATEAPEPWPVAA